MSYSLIVLPAVLEELTQAVRERNQFEAGPALLAEMIAVFNRIRERPLRYPIVYTQVHRALTRRFHFAVFFEVIEVPTTCRLVRARPDDETKKHVPTGPGR